MINKFTSLVLIIFLCGSTVSAQVDYNVYANVIYRFTKYIDWPENMKAGDFIIGVVGESPLYEELKKVTAGKRVGNQRIVVKLLPARAKSYNAHIVFVADEETANLRRIADATIGKPVLIVSEHQGLISKGSCINFAIVSDHLKLEFGKTNIEKRDLNVASELLNLGSVVN